MRIIATTLVLLFLTSYISCSSFSFDVIVPKNEGAKNIGGHSSVCLNDRMISIGGFLEDFCGEYTWYNDTWSFRTNNHFWTKLAQGPSARGFANAVVDPNTGCVYYLGGIRYNSYFGDRVIFNDFWRFNTDCNHWEQLSITNGPGYRAYHGMVIIGNVIYVFGGVGDTDFTAVNSLHSYNTRTGVWNQILANDPSRNPMPRDGFMMAYAELSDGTPGFVVAMGEILGMYGFTNYQDTWFFNALTQTFINVTTSNNPIISNTASYANIDGEIVIVGGEIPGGDMSGCAPFPQNPTNITMVFNPETLTWYQATTTGTIGVANFKRTTACTIQRGNHQEVWFFGGNAWVPGVGQVRNNNFVRMRRTN